MAHGQHDGRRHVLPLDVDEADGRRAVAGHAQPEGPGALLVQALGEGEDEPVDVGPGDVLALFFVSRRDIQVVEIEIGVRCFGMHFRVGGDRDFEVPDFPETGNEVGRIGVSVGVRLVVVRTFGRVAAQCDEMPHAHVPVLARNVVDFAATRPDAGQVRRGRQVGLVEDALHRVVRSLTRGAVRAVGHGNETRRQHLEPVDRLPQCRLGLLRMRGKELERYGWRSCR